MSTAADEPVLVASNTPNRVVVISVLGVTQIFAWGSTYYLPAVLAKPIVPTPAGRCPGWWAGVSLGLLMPASSLLGSVASSPPRWSSSPGVSAALLAAGLSLSRCRSLCQFLTGVVVIGLGMGAGRLRSGLCHARVAFTDWADAGQSPRSRCLAALPVPSAGLFPRSSMRISDGAAHV